MNQKNQKPYLSIVTRARNDEYAGGYLERLEFTQDILFKQLERQQIESEYILVDWNPPEDKPRLKDAMNWPSNLKYTTTKVIEVEPEIHRRYGYWEIMNINPIVALNAGIRRAKGNFIVHRAGDVIWSDEMVSFIALRELEKGWFYRSNRKCINANILSEDLKSYATVLDYCKNHSCPKTGLE